MHAIEAAIAQACQGVAVTLRRDRLIYAHGGRAVAIAHCRRHLSVHLPRAELLLGIRARHPELDCGLGCVRIRDTQYLPMYELRTAFRAVFA